MLAFSQLANILSLIPPKLYFLSMLPPPQSVLILFQFYATTKKTIYEVGFYVLPTVAASLTPMPVEFTLNESQMANITINAIPRQVNKATLMVSAENAKRGSITVLLTSCLTGLESAV